MSNKEKLFVLYDGRAKSGDADDASVICCEDTERDARRNTMKRDYDGIWYEYDVQGKELVNEKARWDL